MLLEEMGVDAPSREIISRLKKAGIEVSPQQVSNEKRRFRERLNIDDLPVSVIKKVCLVKEVGSTAIVRRAPDELGSDHEKE